MSKVIEQQPATEPVVEETKADAFKRLAQKRMNVALDKIRLIGNLSARGNYEYTEEQIEKIEAALNYAVADTMRQFKPRAERKQCFEL